MRDDLRKEIKYRLAVIRLRTTNPLLRLELAQHGSAFQNLLDIRQCPTLRSEGRITVFGELGRDAICAHAERRQPEYLSNDSSSLRNYDRLLAFDCRQPSRHHRS